ncbi:cytochrome P450 [Mycena amicta]|nr:cytochrome P450 [Mycena amicta]
MFLLLALIVCATVAYILYRRRNTLLLPLPPGPPRDLFIGNLRHMPFEDAPLVFHEWAKRYGDVMYLRLPGRQIVVLDSLEAAQDLLDKRSAIYSDRPSFPMYELLGGGSHTTMLPYGKQLTKHRQMHNAFLNREQCLSYRDMQRDEARVLASNLIKGKEGDHERYLSRFATGVIARLLAGHKITTSDDPYVLLSKLGLEALCRVGAPGATIIDALPFMRHLPRWFPGMHYVRIADEWRPVMRELSEYPLGTVMKEKESGEACPSYLLSQLEQMDEAHYNKDDSEYEERMTNIKGSAAAIFSAGDTTTWSAVASFVLAMVINPAAQDRAQEEIARVVGGERLPDFEDRANLAYVECLVQEVFRWAPGVPLGVPHRCMQDDVYRGMFIPKGSIVFANIKGMTLDGKIYANPERFMPERYLPSASDAEPEPFFLGKFGFGRRVCTGQYLADASVWIAIVTMLATCRIARARDSEGREIIPEGKMGYGLGSHPLEFECLIHARSGQAEQLVEAAVEQTRA